MTKHVSAVFRACRVCLAVACCGGLAAMASAAEPFRISLSVSPFTESMLDRKVIFRDGDVQAQTTADLQKMMVAHGANEVYARIGTLRTFQPGNGDHSVNRGLERARMAKELGLPFNPEIGLFRSYGDITHQPSPDFKDYPQLQVPGPWTSLTVDQMVPILREYGALVAREVLDTGVEVRIWDLGNEVEYGVAGIAPPPHAAFGGQFKYQPPDAVDPEIGKMSFANLSAMPETERIEWLQTHIWPHIARLFAATAEGIRSVDPKARFSTHVSGVAAVLPSLSTEFFLAMRKGGFDVDELGFSFYPTSSRQPPDRTLAFKGTATRAHRELQRPVFIAEFGYPAGQMTSGFLWNSAVEGYPQDPDGQARYLRGLTEWGMKSGVLCGIRPWAPDLVFGWGPMSFFAVEGSIARARPGLRARSRASGENPLAGKAWRSIAE